MGFSEHDLLAEYPATFSEHCEKVVRKISIGQRHFHRAKKHVVFRTLCSSRVVIVAIHTVSAPKYRGKYCFVRSVAITNQPTLLFLPPLCTVTQTAPMKLKLSFCHGCGHDRGPMWRSLVGSGCAPWDREGKETLSKFDACVYLPALGCVLSCCYCSHLTAYES